MTDLRWHIVLSQAGAEWQAHRGLLRKDIESYFPYYHGDSRRGRWLQGVVRPQFPGYLFCGLTYEQSIWQVEDTIGVRNVLRIDGELIRLSERQMERCKADCLKRWQENEPHRVDRSQYQIGQTIAVPYGPFVNIPCQVESIDTKSGRVYAAIGSIKIDFLVNGPALPEMRESVRASAQA